MPTPLHSLLLLGLLLGLLGLLLLVVMKVVVHGIWMESILRWWRGVAATATALVAHALVARVFGPKLRHVLRVVVLVVVVVV